MVQKLGMFYFKNLCQHYLKNYDLSIEHFEFAALKHVVRAFDSTILDVTRYEDLNMEQKQRVDRLKSTHLYSCEELTSIIPNFNVYEEVELRRRNPQEYKKKNNKNKSLRTKVGLSCLYSFTLKS